MPSGKGQWRMKTFPVASRVLTIASHNDLESWRVFQFGESNLGSIFQAKQVKSSQIKANRTKANEILEIQEEQTESNESQ
jgi:hypothetical protein